MSGNVLTMTDILVAIGHFLFECGINRIDANREKMHAWLYDHRSELPLEIRFDERYGLHSEDLTQAISNLSMCRIVYWISNEGRPNIYYFKSEISQLYQRNIDLYAQNGLTEAKLEALVQSYVEFCNQPAT